MPQFSDDDLKNEVFIPLPDGKYPVKALAPIVKDEESGGFYDKGGNPMYKIKLEVLNGAYKGKYETWMISEAWMLHLVIHYMRACGMMKDNVVDTMFRENPANSISWDMNRLLNNIEGTRVLMLINTRKGKKDKVYRNMDFVPLMTENGPVKQPAWKEPTQQLALRPSQQTQPPADDGTDLEPDIDLSEDEDFFVD